MSADLFKLDPILRQALAAELSSAERVVYIGRPDWRAETGQLSMIFLFGLCWFAVTGILWVLCLFGTVGIIPFKMEGEIAPWYVPILATAFMTPFVAGGGILMGIPIFAILKSRLSVHAITDQRIISVYAGYGCGVGAVPLTALNFVRRRDRRNGTGSLSIGYGIIKDADGDPRPLTLDWSGIPDVRRAEQLLREHAKWIR